MQQPLINQTTQILPVVHMLYKVLFSPVSLFSGLSSPSVLFIYIHNTENTTMQRPFEESCSDFLWQECDPTLI